MSYFLKSQIFTYIFSPLYVVKHVLVDSLTCLTSLCLYRTHVKIGFHGSYSSMGSIGMQVLQEHWDPRNKKVKGKSQQALGVNQKLRFVESELIKIGAEVPMCDDSLYKVKDIYFQLRMNA